MLNLPVARLRTLIVALCVALMAVLAGQSATAAIDRAQHGAGLDHAPAMSAGLVHLDDDHHEIGHDPSAEAGDVDGDPSRHHHHGDGPQTPALGAEAATATPLARSATHAIVGDAPRASSMRAGPLRPPRASETNFA